MTDEMKYKLETLDVKIDQLNSLIKLHERWRVHSLNNVISHLRVIQARITSCVLILFTFLGMVLYKNLWNEAHSWTSNLGILGIFLYIIFIQWHAERSADKELNMRNYDFDKSNNFRD